MLRQPLVLITALSLTGCQGLATTTVDANQLKQDTKNILTNLVQQASIALKAVNDAGEEVLYNSDDVQQLIVDGKETAAKFSAAGALLLDVAPGDSKNVTVKLKDGATVQVPVKTDKNDFVGGKPPEYDAFVMAGASENQLVGEVLKAGKGAYTDVFKGKSVRIQVQQAGLTKDNIRRVFINQTKLPRQTFFVDGQDLMLHPSNLWVMASERGIQIPSAQCGGPNPGQMGGPTPQGPAGQPMNAPRFGVAQAGMPPGSPMPMQAQPLPGQPAPLGMQQPSGQPMQGGAQPARGPMRDIVFRVVYEIGPGKFKVVIAKVVGRVPGPPPQPCNGTAQFSAEPPSIPQGDMQIKSEDMADMDGFEKQLVAGVTNRLVGQAPVHAPLNKPGAPAPGGMQPPPMANGGQPPVGQQAPVSQQPPTGPVK